MAKEESRAEAQRRGEEIICVHRNEMCGKALILCALCVLERNARLIVTYDFGEMDFRYSNEYMPLPCSSDQSIWMA
jgi:hypothetical protein